MNADWTNEEAILRDLAIIQGNVPVDHVEAVSSNEKPPSLHIVEETEEQFIQECGGGADGDTNVQPDIDLIQQMLELVRDVRVMEIEASDAVTEGETIRIDETKNLENNIPPKKHIDKGKRNRNAAVESLLDLNKNQVGAASVRDDEAKENKSDNAMIGKPPENMFRPKTNKSSSANIEKARPNVKNVTGVVKPGVFVPSSGAQEYYQKVIEKKRLEDLRNETIWTRAERQMKEIEAKRNNSNVT